MKEQFAKLIDVKSIITFIVIIGLVVFTQEGFIEGDKFFQIVTVIVTFYFGTQNGKAQAAASQTITVEQTPLQITTKKEEENKPSETPQNDYVIIDESAAHVGEK